MAGKNDEGDSLKAYSQCRLSEIYGHEKNKKSISAMLAERKLPNGILSVWAIRGRKDNLWENNRKVLALRLRTHTRAMREM